MCLYRKGRDALTAVLDVALHEQDGPVALPEICARTGLGMHCLEDIFQSLLDHGIVTMTCEQECRYLLLQSPEALTAAEIVLAVEEGGTGNALACGNGTSHIRARDDAQRVAEDLWSRLDANLIGYLSTVTVKDIAARHADGPCGAWMH